ncbi:hypothetical protein [Nostoc sp.]
MRVRSAIVRYASGRLKAIAHNNFPCVEIQYFIICDRIPHYK